jgi:hypothetical protein
MFIWIESQPTPLIVLLVFGLCYALAALVYILMMSLSGRPIAAELKATSPTMLTPLGVIIGLVIAFLASHVWSNLNNANTYVMREASALRGAVLLADALPDDTQAKVRDALKVYFHFVETEDWPAMVAGRANLRRPPPGLPDAMRAILAAAPTGPGQQLAQQRAIAALEQALEARRSRILLSVSAIASSQWIVILTLYVLVLLVIGMLHIDRRVTAASSLFIFSTAVAACLVLLMVSDRPFSSGGRTLTPGALREVVVE